jgi:hypothetical protein
VAKQRTLRKNVTYHPPATSDIQQYTRTVCKELAETIDSEFDTPEVRNELAGFIKVVASICSKQLNKGVEILLDREEPTE